VQQSGPFSHLPQAPYAPAPQQAYPQPAYPQQAYPQPSQPMPFAQSYAQPIPGQPMPAPPFGQPFPQAAPPQAYGQPYPQGPAPGQGGQPAPIAPVPAPSYTQPVTQNQQPNPQQAAREQSMRQAVSLARTLEQVIPAYQLAISILQEALAGPKAASMTGAQAMLDAVKDAVCYHFSTLGAIRRFLCGEATPEVITGLAVAVNHLSRVHSQLRPQADRLIVSVPPELRGSLASLSQGLGAADTQVQQAVSSVQANVSAQVWETAKARVLAATVPTAAATAPAAAPATEANKAEA
jgi:hypothetical protein